MGGDRPGRARRAAADRDRGAHRRPARARPARRGGRATDGAGPGAPAQGAVQRPADAGAVPVRAAGRGADRVRRRPSRPRPGAGHRARPGAAGAARADPRRRSGPGRPRSRAAPSAGAGRGAGVRAVGPFPPSCRPTWPRSPGGTRSWPRSTCCWPAWPERPARPGDRVGGEAGERRLGDGSAVPIAVLAGTAGVGKTALAVRWARRAAAAFPDGQLYVNLRGYDPGAPVAPGDALAGFLRALGMAGRRHPGRGRRARRRLPQPARRPAGAGRARQRRQRASRRARCCPAARPAWWW